MFRKGFEGGGKRSKQMYISNRVTKTEMGIYNTNMNTKPGANECTHIQGRKKTRIKE